MNKNIFKYLLLLITLFFLLMIFISCGKDRTNSINSNSNLNNNIAINNNNFLNNNNNLNINNNLNNTNNNNNSIDQATFLLHDSEGPNAGGGYASELGVNTIPIFLDDWASYEPTEGNYDWTYAFPNNIDQYAHSFCRIGLLHVLAWGPSQIPGWANTADLNGTLKTQYGNYISAALAEMKTRSINADYFIVELESNYAGHELSGYPDITNQWIIDWIKWEVGIITSFFPNAKIIIALTPTEFRPEETLDNTFDKGKILISDFMGRLSMDGVTCEAYGFNIASGPYDRVDDWLTVEAQIDDWSKTINKKYYVWAMGYPADNNQSLPFHNPRPGGYSEIWQTTQYVNTLAMLLNDPNAIGVSVDLYDYQEGGWAGPFHWGLVGGDTATPTSLYKRPSFDAVKNYWLTNYR